MEHLIFINKKDVRVIQILLFVDHFQGVPRARKGMLIFKYKIELVE
jgi:hypothetical protein